MGPGRSEALARRGPVGCTSGAQQLATYAWNTGEAPHHFCKVCGSYTHPVMRGAPQRIGVNMACIEVIDVFALGDVELGSGKSLSIVGLGKPLRES